MGVHLPVLKLKNMSLCYLHPSPSFYGLCAMIATEEAHSDIMGTDAQENPLIGPCYSLELWI